MVEGNISKVVIESTTYDSDSENPKAKLVLCDSKGYIPEEIDRRANKVVITTEPSKGYNFFSYI